MSVSHNYLVPKDSTSILGFIQDHVVSGVLLTLRDTFLVPPDFMRLVFVAFTAEEMGHGGGAARLLYIPRPAMLLPQRLYTGKQVVTTLLRNIIPEGGGVGGGQPSHCRINLTTKSKTPSSCWSVPDDWGPVDFEMSESNVVFRDGEFLCGVIDKKHCGAAQFGLTHCCHEFYGPRVATNLLSSFRVFITYLQTNGFTLGVWDILMSGSADIHRWGVIDQIKECGPTMVRKELSRLFPLLFNDVGNAYPVDVLFIESLLVEPVMFRPIFHFHGERVEHPRTIQFRRVIEAPRDQLLTVIRVNMSAANSGEGSKKRQSISVVTRKSIDKKVVGKTIQEKLHNAYGDLQVQMNLLYDEDAAGVWRDAAVKKPGLKQIFERKEGIFRMNMMGKRVNFACRSITTPDPYLDVDEIGVPVYYTRKLTLTEPVSYLNAGKMRANVRSGPDCYPGANAVDTAKSQAGQHSSAHSSGMAADLVVTEAPMQTQRLNKGNATQRAVCAKRLVEGKSQVYRHMENEDSMLMNRQLTLHKPSIMGHRIRVLRTDAKALRMNYAPCKAYNADFDGDEMNGHFVQSRIAQAEASQLMSVSHNYLVPKDSIPILGFIQDHVVSGVLLTLRDIFLVPPDFMRLVFVAFTAEEMGHGGGAARLLYTPRPAMLLPQRLYTGKQVVTTLLRNIIPEGEGVGGGQPSHCRINLTTKSKTPPSCWGAPDDWGPVDFEMSESNVIFRDGELLCGVIDKQHCGATQFGLTHCCHELYGPRFATKLLSCFSRVFTTYLQMRGFTLGVADILMSGSADTHRQGVIEEIKECGPAIVRKALDLEEQEEEKENLRTLKKAMGAAHNNPQLDTGGVKLLDHSAKTTLDKMSKRINDCLRGDLIRSFPSNNLQLMILSGAKGTIVNAIQISCALGQIELEGQRSPLTAPYAHSFPVAEVDWSSAHPAIFASNSADGPLHLWQVKVPIRSQQLLASEDPQLRRVGTSIIEFQFPNRDNHDRKDRLVVVDSLETLLGEEALTKLAKIDEPDVKKREKIKLSVTHEDKGRRLTHNRKKCVVASPFVVVFAGDIAPVTMFESYVQRQRDEKTLFTRKEIREKLDGDIFQSPQTNGNGIAVIVGLDGSEVRRYKERELIDRKNKDDALQQRPAKVWGFGEKGAIEEQLLRLKKESRTQEEAKYLLKAAMSCIHSTTAGDHPKEAVSRFFYGFLISRKDKVSVVVSPCDFINPIAEELHAFEKQFKSLEGEYQGDQAGLATLCQALLNSPEDYNTLESAWLETHNPQRTVERMLSLYAHCDSTPQYQATLLMQLVTLNCGGQHYYCAMATKILRLLSTNDRGRLISARIDATNRQAIHLASADGEQCQLEALLKYNADPNVLDGFGHTPLHYAIERGDRRLVRSLMQHGGDIAQLPLDQFDSWLKDRLGALGSAMKELATGLLAKQYRPITPLSSVHTWRVDTFHEGEGSVTVNLYLSQPYSPESTNMVIILLPFHYGAGDEKNEAPIKLIPFPRGLEVTKMRIAPQGTTPSVAMSCRQHTDTIITFEMPLARHQFGDGPHTLTFNTNATTTDEGEAKDVVLMAIMVMLCEKV